MTLHPKINCLKTQNDQDGGLTFQATVPFCLKLRQQMKSPLKISSKQDQIFLCPRTTLRSGKWV